MHKGKIAVLNQDNIDTDRIIPARYLSMVTKSGYGELAFRDVRGPEFPLDAPEAKGATILVVGTNFGCGSSREHAVWALQQAGYRAVVSRTGVGSDGNPSPGFSDIFRQNAANCGLLLIELPEDAHAELLTKGSGHEVEIDLPAQQIRSGGQALDFDIAEGLKKQHMEGLDLIGTTLRLEPEIEAYERERTKFIPDPSR